MTNNTSTRNSDIARALSAVKAAENIMNFEAAVMSLAKVAWRPGDPERQEGTYARRYYGADKDRLVVTWRDEEGCYKYIQATRGFGRLDPEFYQLVGTAWIRCEVRDTPHTHQERVEDIARDQGFPSSPYYYPGLMEVAKATWGVNWHGRLKNIGF